MASQITTMLAELNAAKQDLAPKILGLGEFLAFPLTPSAREPVAKLKAGYDRRAGLIEAALRTLRDLVDDDYPEVATQGLSTEAFTELGGDRTNLEAAWLQFHEGEATEIGLDVGTPEPK